MCLTLTYSVHGSGYAGHIQPRFELSWDYAMLSTIPNVPGYDDSFPAPVSSPLKAYLWNHKDKQKVSYFIQCDERWLGHRKIEGDSPGPTEGDGYFLIEFWSHEYQIIEAMIPDIVSLYAKYGVDVSVVKMP